MFVVVEFVAQCDHDDGDDDFIVDFVVNLQSDVSLDAHLYDHFDVNELFYCHCLVGSLDVVFILDVAAVADFDDDLSF